MAAAIYNLSLLKYDTSDLNQSYALLTQAFLQGDFDSASTRLRQIEIMISAYSINLPLRELPFLMIIYHRAIIFVLLLAAIMSFIYRQQVYSFYRNNRLSSLGKEENEIIVLIKEIQRQHFNDKIIGDDLYSQYLDEYRKRRAKIKEEAARLEVSRIKHMGGKLSLTESKQQKDKIIGLMKDLQIEYYERKSLDTDSYSKILDEYNIALSEIDELLAKHASKGNKKIIPNSSDAVCADGEAFILKGGRRLHSINQISSALKTITPTEFQHHVNMHRNDFASWVSDVFKENELAGRMRKAKNKEEMIKVIEDEISY
jgi:hypothetical protein